MLFSNCSHSASLRPQLIILYKKCLRRESECLLLLSNAAVSAETLSHEIHWEISPKKVEKVKPGVDSYVSTSSALTGCLSKPAGENVAKSGRRRHGWCWIKNELRYRSGEEEVDGQGGRRRGSGRWRRVKEAVGADSIASSVLSIQSDSADWHN